MVLGPPWIILKSEGTANREGSGSARTMFVNRNVCSPIRGSFRLLETIVLRSVEVTDLFSVPASAAGGDCCAEAEFFSNLRSPYTLRLAPGEPVSRFGRRKSTIATQRKTPSGKGVLGQINRHSSCRRRRCGPSRAGSDR